MTGAPKLGSGFQQSEREKKARSQAKGVKPFHVPDVLLPLFQDPIALGHALGFTGLTDELHGEAYRHLLSHRRAYAEFPRGHYKSTLASEVLTIFIKLRDMEARVLHMCATLSLAKKFQGNIIRRIYAPLNVPGYRHLRLVDVFPWLKVKKYNEDTGIVFEGQSGLNKEPCIAPASVERALEGIHPTVIITDDLSNRKNSMTPESREKVIRAYKLLTPIAEDMTCPIWTVGTPWAFTDLSNHLKKIINVPTFRKSILDGPPPPGREKEDPPLFLVGEEREEHRGWPLAPHIYNEQDIRLLCTPGQAEYVGYEEFYANFLCEPTAGEDQMFNLDVWNGTLEEALSPKSGADEWGLLDEGYEVAFVDPAAKSDGKGCKTGICVYRIYTAKEIGYTGLPDLANIFVPVEVMEIASGGARMVKEIVRLAHSRRRLRDPRGCVAIEAQTMVEMVKPWMVEELPVKMAPIHLRGNSKERRLMGLQLAMMQGRWKRAREFPGSDLLRDYLLRYPLVDSMDVLDATALVSLLPRKGVAAALHQSMPEQGTVGWHDRYVEINTPQRRRR